MNNLRKYRLLAVLVAILCVMAAHFVYAKELEVAVQYSTIAEYEQQTGKSVGSLSEAPELAEWVTRGELPPLEDRLPKEPAVLVPTESIGKYGGTLRRTRSGPRDHWDIRKFLGERFLVMTPEGDIIPNVAKDYEVLEGGRKFVFYMREGMKWSDGHPVTADDAVFWWEFKGDPRLYFPHRQEFIMDGKMADIEKIDEYTFSITFPRPSGTFLLTLATEGRGRLLAPKHYLKQFHMDYAEPEELKQMMREAGYEDNWAGFFDSKYQEPDKNPERPVITAWRPINGPSDAIYMFERNPYYWKVDPEGNQLPYIDRIAHEMIADPEMRIMRAVTGNVDFFSAGISDIAVLMENAESGGYRVLTLPRADTGAEPVIAINQNHRDPVIRKVFEDVRFRRALSLAIDRDEINEILHFGLGIPRQASFTSDSPFYSEEWATAYAEFDPDRANKLLDEAGLDWGADGYRKYPDGRQLAVTVEISDGTYVAEMELIGLHWNRIGVKLNINTPERTLFSERTFANEFDMVTWHMDGGDRPDLWFRWWAVATEGRGYHWGPMWNRWYESGGEAGEEPPVEIKRLNEILQERASVTDLDELKALMAEVTAFHTEKLFMIGTVGEFPVPLVVNNRLRNVPTNFVWTELNRSPGNAIPQQFFFADE